MTDQEEQQESKGAQLSPEQQLEWGNDVNIIEPGVKREDGKATKEEDPDDQEVEDQEDEVEEDLEDAEELDQTVSVEDPGEFTPSDYSFEITTYDEEGKNPRTRKISSVEQWDKLLDADPNFGNAAALLRAQRAATKMETALDRDKRDYDKAKADYDKAVEDVNTREAGSTRLISEMAYLEERGDMPRVPNKYRNDWNTADAKKNDAVKQQLALLSYMSKENKSRTKAGLEPMHSLIDAYNAMQLDSRRTVEKNAKQAAGEARKAAGARVASGSPSPVGGAPAGISVGQGGSLRDLNSGWR